MIALRAVGMLERFETFPHEIDLAAVRNMKFRRDIPARFLYQNIRLLRTRGGEEELVRALEAALDGPRPARRFLATLGRRLGLARPRRASKR